MSTTTAHARGHGSTDTPILHAEAITHTFGSLLVTDSVTLELAPGERHGLIGPNGAGKTTLFNIIAGEIVPDSGSVHLGGVDVTRLKPDRRARLGLARSFQHNNLFTDLTVRENLSIAGAIAHRVGHVAWRAFARHREVHASAESLAVALGLEAVLNTVVRHLSYGTQRQLEIALALALDPMILLLDEPTSSLDVETEKSVIHALRRLCRSKTTLTIAHRLSTIVDSDESLGMRDGGIAERGSHPQLMAQGGWYAQMFTLQLDQVDAALAT